MEGIFKRSTFFKEWTAFIKQNYARVVFIPLFYSLKACTVFVQYYDLSLHRFPGRMIGGATVAGIDIAKRVSVFYDSICIMLAINAVFYLAAFMLLRRKQYNLRILSILNISSMVGCLLVFLTLLKLCLPCSVNLVIFIHIPAIIFLISKIFFAEDSNKRLFNPVLFSVILCISVCFMFFMVEFLTFLHVQKQIYFPFLFPFISSLFVVLATIYIKRFDNGKAVKDLIKFFWVLKPVMLIPLFSVLKDEIYLILNNRGILYFTPVKLYLLILVLTAAWIYIRSRKPVGKLDNFTLNRMLSNYYFPVLILGITTFIYYHPIINEDVDMFEAANRFLPVMELLKFHTVPLIEKFNSHMLSEIIGVYFYSILNKMNGTEPLIYDFIFPVSTALITYFIIRDMTHNPFVALFTVLLLPFTKCLISGYFSPALLAVYVLYKIIYGTPSVKIYLLLCCSLIFFLFWRIDLGVACLWGTTAILVLYTVSGIAKFNYKFLLTAIGYILVAALLIFLVFLSFRINLISNLLNQYNYLSSAQSYGYNVLGNATEKVFRVQYFIFPAIMLLLCAYIFLHLKRFITYGNSKFLTLCLLFCIVFYFANFPRGLVRHSFVENSDIRLSSFIFFTLSASFYLLCRNLSQSGKFLLFFFSSFLLLDGFKFGDWNLLSVYESFRDKISDFQQIQPHAGINRQSDSSVAKINTIAFQDFISKELKDNETFIDFSNEPMLYYYTQKITPSYFFQNPLSMHNDYLQDRFIKNLDNYKTPLLVFSNYPSPDGEWSFNNLDGVPNALRHYRIAEYLYNNYQPFAIIQNYCLWKNKKSDLEDTVVRLFTLNKDSQHIVFPDDTFQKSAICSILTSMDGNIFITIDYAKSGIHDCGLTYRDSRDSAAKKMEVLFNDTSAHRLYYSLKHEKGEKIRFYINHFENLSEVEMDDAKYIPDFYSLQPHHWKIDMLPYIWANYDERILTSPVIDIIEDRDTIISKSKVSFNLPDDIDKSGGNYIYISLDASNDNPVPVQLTYGPGNGEFDFTIPPGNGTRTFAIRISSQYKWYAKKNTNISLYVPGDTKVYLKKMSLLKGD